MNQSILDKQRQAILDLATIVYDDILRSPIRLDDKERTGIRVLVKIEGTKDMIFVDVYRPSEKTMYFASEKTIRCERDGLWSSGDNANLKEDKYHGCIVIVIGGKKVFISVSGLKEEEDTLVALFIGTYMTLSTLGDVMAVIMSHNGIIHDTILDKEYYLYPLMQPFISTQLPAYILTLKKKN